MKNQISLIKFFGAIMVDCRVEIQKKKNVSRKKLCDFFGELVPVDVSILEIESIGLSAMLQSSVPLCYFLHCLLENMSTENLVFLSHLDLLLGGRAVSIILL